MQTPGKFVDLILITTIFIVLSSYSLEAKHNPFDSAILLKEYDPAGKKESTQLINREWQGLNKSYLSDITKTLISDNVSFNSADNLPPKIVNISYTNDVTTSIKIEISEEIDKSTLNSSTISVQGTKSSQITCSYDFDISNNIIINPDQNFLPKESITVTLTNGIKDLSGNGLDSDGDGTIGPNKVFSFTIAGFNHDYAVDTIWLSKYSPLVDELIVVTGIVKNEGLSTEASNQNIFLYDNGVKVSTYSSFPSLAPGAEQTQSFNWLAKSGAHELKFVTDLVSDENSANNIKTISCFVEAAGTLIIDGSQNPTKNFTLSENTQEDYSIQLQNTGSTSVSGTVSKTGSAANWVSPSGGTTFSVQSESTASYNYRITVPAGTSVGTYSAQFVFSYEGGTKTNILSLNVNVNLFSTGIYAPASLNPGSVVIDGAWSKTQIITHMVNSSASFYLDNSSTTSDPSSAPAITYTISTDDYNKMYSAVWETNFSEDMQSSTSSGIRTSITETAKSKNFSTTVNSTTDIMTWINVGPNTFNCGLDNFVSNAANVQWYVSSSSPYMKFGTSGWGASCSIGSSDLTTMKNGWNTGRIYFTVNSVAVPGNLKLYNNGTLVTTTLISSSDVGSTKYFTITSSKTNTSNYYVIIGENTTSTKVTISNIRLEITYLLGDPNVICTKSISKNNALVNENIILTLQFNNAGSNIANETTYDDTPIPSGLSLVSGSLNGNLIDLLPATLITPINYTVKPTLPGIYTWGATPVSFNNISTSKTFTSTSNSVSLRVNGGTLVITGDVDKSVVKLNEKILISGTVTEDINNSPVTDAKVTCTVKNLKSGIIFRPFLLVFNFITQKYEGEFNETGLSGNYEINIMSELDFYTTGNLSSPLVFKVPFIEFDKNYLLKNSSSGKESIAVNSNIKWSITESSEWLSCTVNGGTSFNIDYLENTAGYPRSAIISIDTVGISKVVIIEQEAKTNSGPNPPLISNIIQPTCSVVTGSVMLNGLPSSGTWTLTRSPGGATTTGTGLSTTISGLAPGTYTYTVMDITGTISSPSTDVVINTQPSIPAIPTVGTITQPNCLVATGGVALTGLPSSGTWTLIRSPGGATTTGSGTTTNIAGLIPGTYKYTVTNSSSCISAASASIIITSSDTPVTPIIGPITQPTCAVPTGSVEISSLPSTGTWIITRSPGDATKTGTSTSATITSLASGTYTFSVTNASSCISAPTASVTINAQPTTPSAPVIGTLTQPTCEEATGSVAISGLPSTGSWSIIRSPGGTTITGAGISTTINSLPSGTHTFTVTNASSCISASSAAAVINTQPVTQAVPVIGTITHPTCTTATGSVVLNGLPAAGTWSIMQNQSGATITGIGTTTTISGLIPGTFNFTVTNSSGCSSSSGNVTINAVQIGIIPVIVKKWNDVLICYNINNKIDKYQWYRGTTPITGETLEQFYWTKNQSGAYQVLTIDKEGCKNFSNIIQIGTGSKSFNAYPNPARGNITIDLNDVPIGKAVIAVFNTMGIKVKEIETEKEFEDFLHELPIETLDEGIYFVRVTIDKVNVYSTKIVVEK